MLFRKAQIQTILSSNIGRPFKYGRHDCFTLCRSVYTSIFGNVLPRVSYRTEEEAVDLFKEYSWHNYLIDHGYIVEHIKHEDDIVYFMIAKLANGIESAHISYDGYIHSVDSTCGGHKVPNRCYNLYRKNLDITVYKTCLSYPHS